VFIKIHIIIIIIIIIFIIIIIIIIFILFLLFIYLYLCINWFITHNVHCAMVVNISKCYIQHTLSVYINYQFYVLDTCLKYMLV